MSPRSQRPNPTHPGHRFCPPCYAYGAGAAAASPATLDEHDNPLPFMRDMSAAATFMPIKAFWFPGPLVPGDWYIFGGHECLHLMLADTTVGFYVGALTQAEYVTFIKLVAAGQSISLPSLREPSGMFAMLQAALDVAEVETLLVHELVATTVQRVNADRGRVCLTASCHRRIGEMLEKAQLGWLPAEPVVDGLAPRGYLMATVPPALAEKVQSLGQDVWLPAYSKSFVGYDFCGLHSNLLDAWKRLQDTIDHETETEERILTNLILALARYPFDIPLQFPWNFRWPDVRLELEFMAQYLTRMSEQPLRRLHAIVETVTNAPALRGGAAWVSYLRASLPGFTGWPEGLSGWAMLSQFTKSLWERELDTDNQLYSVFDMKYSSGFSLTMYLNGLPLFRSDGKFLPLEDMATALETTRQSLLTGRGPVCLCTSELRATCKAKLVVRDCWRSARADDDPQSEQEFAEYWRKPECG